MHAPAFQERPRSLPDGHRYQLQQSNAGRIGQNGNPAGEPNGPRVGRQWPPVHILRGQYRRQGQTDLSPGRPNAVQGERSLDHATIR